MSNITAGSEPTPPSPVDASTAPAPASSVRTRLLLEGPILRALLKLSAPNLLNLLALTIIITFDGFFIGRLGAEALAGVSLVFPFLMLMQHMSAGGIGGGVSSAVARALGAGRRDTADAIATHALVVAIGMALLLAAGEALFGRAVFAAMGAQGRTLDVALAYANIIFSAGVALWLVNVLSAVVRGTGHMVLPAAVLCGCAVLHATISPLLIFGVGPLAALGVAGAGVGLMLSFALGAAVLIAYLRTPRTLVRLRARHLRPRRAVLAEILRVGVPATLNTILTNVGVMLLTAVVATFGSVAVAGFGMGVRVEYVLMPLTFVLGTSLVTMVGTNVGAGRFDRAERTAWIGGAVMATLGGIIGIAIALFPYAWIGLFTADPQVLDIGAKYARIVGPFYTPFVLGLSLYFAFQGGGRLFWPLTASVLRLAIAVGGGWAAIHWLGWGLSGFFAMIALAFTLYGAIIAFALRAGTWRQRATAH